VSTKLVHELPYIESQVVALDIETTSTPGRKISNPWENRIVSIAVTNGEDIWILPPTGNMKSVVPLINNPEIKKVGHNIQFDLSFITQQCDAQAENAYDTMILSRMLHAGKGLRHGLDDCLAYELGITLDKSTREQFYQHSGDLTEEQLHYIAEDVAHLLPLREKQVKDIIGAGLQKVATIENKAVLTVVDLYLTGVLFDKELWATYEDWINQKLIEIKQAVVEATSCGYTQSMFEDLELAVNLSSVKQLANLFAKHDIKVANTQEATLVKYIETHPDTEKAKLLSLILEYKNWRKKLSWKFDEHVNPVTGRIHPSWNPLNADSGRFSCSEPNLQQVPRPKEGEPNFRQLFMPPEGSRFVTADFSQQEVRVLAQICGDKDLRAACESGDVYTQIAKQVYGKDVVKGSEERFIMKTAVLACSYGAREKKLTAVLGVSEKEAEKLRNMIFSTYPGIKTFADTQLRSLIQKGFVTTQLGRRRYFPEIATTEPGAYWKFASQAMNSPVQGTAADIGKLALWKIRDYYKETTDIRPALFIHDEIILQAPEDKAEEVKFNLIGAMEEASSSICPDVKIYVEAGITDRWEKI
jgi:DNA polymerase-1